MKFTDASESGRFYQNRYLHGYMGFWSDFEQERMRDILSSMELPEKGKALDYGCGRGIFTALIKEVLPDWEVYACDISPEAVRFAAENNKGIHFEVLSSNVFEGIKFDLIHTHHVLEHVFDVKEVSERLCSWSSPGTVMLHTIPCNMPGSLEQKVASMRADGIDPENGTYFFEDEAHLRRLSEEQAIRLFSSCGYKKIRSLYTNHLHGAYLWMAESTLGLVLNFTNSKPVIRRADKKFVCSLRRKMLFNWFCAYVAGAFSQGDRGGNWKLKKALRSIAYILLFWLVVPVHNKLRNRAIREWEEKRLLPEGSEMFLILQKS